MSNWATPAAEINQQAGPVEVDLPCRKCSYNLRGLSTDGRCPECGTAVGFSTQGDYLQYSSPAWLDQLARGARIYIWGIAVLIIGSIVAGIAFRGSGAIAWIQLGAFSMLTVGWWLLTEPDPSGLGEDRYGTARKLIRIGLLGSVIEQFVDSVTTMGGPQPPGVALVLSIVQFCLGILALIAFFAQLNYMRKLALRVPSSTLAGRAHFLTKAFAIAFPLLIVAAIAFGFLTAAQAGAPGQGLASAMYISGGAALILLVALLVFGVKYLLLIERMGKTFRDLAATARRTWAADAVRLAPVP